VNRKSVKRGVDFSSLRNLRKRLRRLKGEKEDLLLEVKKLKKEAKSRVKNLEKETKALREKVADFRELLESLGSQ